MSVYAEDWAANYGSPYMIVEDEGQTGDAELVEDGKDFRCHDPIHNGSTPRLAFVDGVRRGEAALYQVDDATGRVARAVAGGHACGAVVVEDGDRPEFGESRVMRIVICGSGLKLELPDVHGGWTWRAVSIAKPAPDAPLQELQTRMREEEGRLAEDLSDDGYLVIVDGPLSFVRRRRDVPIVGFIKTHQRMLLPPEEHMQIPTLGSGQRSSIFRLGDDRYSCYMRVGNGFGAGPWHGIVRLEVPQSAGMGETIRVVDEVAAIVPRYAGVPHCDPRAPQNLQPVGALEKYLRHLLGDSGLAVRAVREAVYSLASGGG